MRQIRCQLISTAAFEPFGLLIQSGSGPIEVINDGSTQRHSDLAALDLRGPESDPVVAVYVAQARRFPLPIVRLEQHREASQTFVPLGVQRFVVVVASGKDAPDWTSVAAFLTEPGQGVSLRRGCWHHGLIALGDGDRFVVIEGGNYRRDTFEIAAPGTIVLCAPA